ncbi:MAG: hypothetical protein ACRELC_01965, partial [Gemmatimonadota bacterium]
SVLKIEPQAVVEQNVTMFPVLTRIGNDDHLLRPGMNADVQIVIGREEDVLALPNSALKTPQEATQLARALGIDVDMETLEREAAAPGGDGEPAGSGQPTESAPASSEDTLGGVPVSRLRTMSQDERREWFRKLSDEERRRAIARFRRQGGADGGTAAPVRTGEPRPAFVFVYGPDSTLTLKPVTIGLGNYDVTQIVHGLEEGDEVVSVPLSLIQQQDFLERIRSRNQLPGVQRN